MNDHLSLEPPQAWAMRSVWLTSTWPCTTTPSSPGLSTICSCRCGRWWTFSCPGRIATTRGTRPTARRWSSGVTPPTRHAYAVQPKNIFCKHTAATVAVAKEANCTIDSCVVDMSRVRRRGAEEEYLEQCRESTIRIWLRAHQFHLQVDGTRPSALIYVNISSAKLSSSPLDIFNCVCGCVGPHWSMLLLLI